MGLFVILCRGLSIGSSDLEYVDAGMGVAYGRFQPSAAYPAIRQEIVVAAEARHDRRGAEPVPLEVRTTSGESVIAGFVVIDDFTEAHADPEITVQFEDREQFLRLTGAA